MILILDDIRSLHNVGAILRSADAFAIEHVYYCGITPYPRLANDSRLPHVIERATKHIRKTALGAESTVQGTYEADINQLIERLKNDGVHMLALEQAQTATMLADTRHHEPLALILGAEVEGVKQSVLRQVDAVVEIPMRGKKESLNVSVAAGIAMYELTRT